MNVKNALKTIILLQCLLSAFYLNAQIKNLLVQKVWDQARHNAFPDIRFYKGDFYIVFRESNFHVPKTDADDGKIRVLKSRDGRQWNPFQLIEKKGFDLRDPMLEITSDGRLMLLMGGSVYNGSKLTATKNHVSFLENSSFAAPQPVHYNSFLYSDFNWLWSITWKRDVGYGVIYQFEPDREKKLMLATTRDGGNYSLLSNLNVQGNESKVTFINNRKAMMVVRRDDAPFTGAFGISKKPFTNWSFKNMSIRLGGPHLVRVNRNLWILSSRGFVDDKTRCTSLYALNKKGTTQKLLDLPECGNFDLSYPGLELSDGNLYVAYYSGHEGNVNIYLAIIPVTEIKRLLRN